MDDKDLESLLHSAIQHHNDTLLDDLLADGNGSHLLDLHDQDGNTLLHITVLENDHNSLKVLLKKGANPNVFDANKARTPLHLAVELGLDEIVKSFLELDYVDLELRDDRNLTCYEIAQFCDNQALSELIDGRRQKIEEQRNEFYSVINKACTNDDPNLVRELLGKYEQNIRKKLPHSWIKCSKGTSVVGSSLKQMINWSSSSWNDVTLLFKTASKGHTEVCKLLIDYGATAKCNENTNYSPLYVAAYGGFTDTVKLLLDSFPSLVQEVTIEKWTVLHACCLQGHSDTAKLILGYSYPELLKRRYVSRSGLYEYSFAFDLNAQDAAGQTAIYLAVSANNESLLDTLLHFNIEAKSIQNLQQQQQQQQQQARATVTVTDNQPSRDTGRARIIPERPRMKQDAELAFKNQANNQLDKILRQLQKLKSKEDHQSSSGKSTHNDLRLNQTNITSAATAVGPGSKLLDADKYLICPFEMDTYCDYNSKTALHLSVCQQYHTIATTLLVNGANPNLPILFRDSINRSSSDLGDRSPGGSSPSSSGLGVEIGLNWLRSSKSTCLKEACRLNDVTMCDILIRYGARDNQDNLALQVAALNKNNTLISMFLSLKSNVDPEFKINRKCNVEFASRYKPTNQQSTMKISSTVTTTFSSMFPSVPVTIDWQNLRFIKQIEPQWLIDASLQHNKRLRHPTNSLMAITRLDLSCNNLKSLHPVIFKLPSLRELNLSSNRLESLLDFSHQHPDDRRKQRSQDGDILISGITNKLIESHKTAMKRSKSSSFSSGVNLETSNLIDLNEPQGWDLPCLEVLDLHDNLLISLPDCLFELPKLSELDVSSNQLRQLPWSMWTAPSLKELIASGNLLDDLPRVAPMSQMTSPEKGSLQSSQLEMIRDSPTQEEHSRTSLTSNQSFDRLDQSTSQKSALDSSHEVDRPQSRCSKYLATGQNMIESHIELNTTQLVHINHWSSRIDLIGGNHPAHGQMTNLDESSCENVADVERLNAPLISKITHLNLSHNSFACIPPVLACIATGLARLNLSFNSLQTLGDISLLPARLKSLDASNNHIKTWFHIGPYDDDTKHCFTENVRQKLKNQTSATSPASVMQRGYGNLFCLHKSHHRLDNLKSLNLSRNCLRTIELHNVASELASTTSPTSQMDVTNSSVRDSITSGSSISSGITNSQQAARNLRQILFPNITALDLSFNQIQQVPTNVSNLKDLSVLNLSGNVQISSLPAQLGLATKLWNLGITGCNLAEPLKSIVESKTYKTMDITGYLRSILEEAKPYARMKLMLVGLQGIGKTSLLEQMRHEGTSGGGGGITRRRGAPEHWTKRMGHHTSTRGSNLRNQKGVTLSTVGVDIHDWMFQKRVTKNQTNFGPVTFSTWDFGGQEEFYATHRYFLSRRSMYLVVWRMTDGFQGILGIQQWLVNIQSRAPNSPVIIVGTHEDMLEGGERGPRAQELQREVYRRFIEISDNDKCGLPFVADSIVVSTKTKLNIKYLCNRIYDVVFSLRCPGSTEKLLEQKIPATYLFLEEIVSSIVHERQQKKREPVLTYEEYRRLTSEQLKQKYNKQFRDLEPLQSREINYNSELQQATRFLHENGILLHYEDANLRDLYFLDPQWLCDILSHVVTIREINPHVKNGLMRIEDLNYLFKSMDVNVSGGVQSYVVNLLNKFEVALTWNSQFLLIPSLLPKDLNLINFNQQTKVVLAPTPRLRGRSAVRRVGGDLVGPASQSAAATRIALSNSIRATSIDPSRRRMSTDYNYQQQTDQQSPGTELKHFYEFQYKQENSLTRLVLLRYLPAGYLARLQSSLLSDPGFDDICEDLQLDILNNLLEENTSSASSHKLIDKRTALEQLISLLGSRPGWICWKRGIRLNLQLESTINEHQQQPDLDSPCLFSLHEYSSSTSEFSSEKVNFKLECLELTGSGANKASTNSSPASKLGQSGGDKSMPPSVEVIGSKWINFDQSQYSNILMIVVPCPSLNIVSKDDHSASISIQFNQQIIARLLAKIVDHIDDLLEDWYPSLGARFAHTLGGSYLVTRIVLCPACSQVLQSNAKIHFKQSSAKHLQNNANINAQQQQQHRSSRVSSRRDNIKFSINAASDRSSLVHPAIDAMDLDQPTVDEVHCFYVEHCILNAYNLALSNASTIGDTSGGNQPLMMQKSSSRYNFNLSALLGSSPTSPQAATKAKKTATFKSLQCPKHGSIALARLAPDIVFDDVCESLKVDNEHIERCKLIGRGALGFVFKGTLLAGSLKVLDSANVLNHQQQQTTNNANGTGNNNHHHHHQEVALKLLQPVEPGPEADQSDQMAYQSARTHWLREPFQSACKSYCQARHEINILLSLCHPNIVQFLGVCIRPLAIILELAPMGSLEEVFKTYKRAGRRIDDCSVQKTIVQLARALEFLHQHRIIYRDLKTENVLVWSFPSSFSTWPQRARVELKLADYGISRQALSTGIWKGFAGTINFLAPEILRHNGDEEYTEKVDCFSFGMLMYELLTLRAPFKQSIFNQNYNNKADGSNQQNAIKLQLQDQHNNHHQLMAGNRRVLSSADGLGGPSSRPSLNVRDLIYPNYFLDLMSICWSQEPQDRPTASQIVSIATTPEFMQILDATPCQMEPATNSFSSLSTSSSLSSSSICHEFNCSIYNEQLEQLDLWSFTSGNHFKSCSFSVTSARNGIWSERCQIKIDQEEMEEIFANSKITASCLVDNSSIWLFDSRQSLMMTVSLDEMTLAASAATSAVDFSYTSEQQQPIMANLPKLQAFPIDLKPPMQTTGGRLASKPAEAKQLNVKQMIYVRKFDCLILLTDQGQLWMCQLISSVNVGQLIELNSIDFNCITTFSDADISDSNESSSRKTTQSPHSPTFELDPTECFRLFGGQTNGISCMDLTGDGEVRRQSILPLSSGVGLNKNTTTTAATKTKTTVAEDDNDDDYEEISLDYLNQQQQQPNSGSSSIEVTSILVGSKNSGSRQLWTAAGCTVHLWDLNRRRVVRKLDCFKLVPCSESLESINIEHYYQQARSSVITSMVLASEQRNQLFVGTSHGCFVAIEASSLKPIIVYRPYESQLTIERPWIFAKQTNNSNNSGSSSSNNSGQQLAHLVMLGRGYRDLIGRFMPTTTSSSNDIASDQHQKHPVMVAAILSAENSNYYNL